VTGPSDLLGEGRGCGVRTGPIGTAKRERLSKMTVFTGKTTHHRENQKSVMKIVLYLLSVSVRHAVA
jgi:hypothetical protein